MKGDPTMTSATQVTLNQIPLLPSTSPFGCPKLHQQAGKIENAAAGFCQTTFDNLRHLGNTGIDFLKKCQQELGEKEGKSAFDNWLDSDGFGASKYVLRVAMKIAARYSNLKPRLQKLACDNVQVWGLRALEDLFGVSDGLFELMIKRGKRSHKAIKKVDDTLEGKQPNLPRGGYVEVILDDDRQLKGSMGKIVDKDEHGLMTVKFPHRPEVVLSPKDLTKQTPKAVADYAFKEIESVKERYDFLQEEFLQKDELIREYELTAASNQISESLIQSQIAQAIAEYERQKSESYAALYEETKAAALADAHAKIEAAEQSIQKLRQQLESKEKLSQLVEDLQLKLLLKQQVESENQSLKQQLLELRSTQLHSASDLDSNQDIVTDVNDLNGLNNPQFKEASISVETNGKEDLELSHTDSLPTLSSSLATLTTSEIEQTTKHLLSHSSDLEMVEINKYQVNEMSKPANSSESTTLIEILELKKKLEISQRQNIELVEANEVLVEMINIIKLDHAGEKLKKHQEKLEKNLGKNTSRPSQVTTSKPLGFAVRKTSASR